MFSTAVAPQFENHPSKEARESLARDTKERDTLLAARIKDLQLHLTGTPLERHIQRLYAEVETHGVSLRPPCYLSDQWGCPSGVPVIGIPFYLADPNLERLEEELGSGLETDQEIMMYLRHEAGHAFNYAYRLYDTPEWKRLFGDFGAPYREEYKPKPFSRKYVHHISGWYAQKHPDEDFAETFAVWLTSDDWRERYQGWGALKKLEYVEAIVSRLGRTTPEVQLADPDIEAGAMEETVLDHYRQRDLAERVDLAIGRQLDEDLMRLFEAPGVGPAPAETLLRSERQLLIQSVTRYSGVSRAVVRSVVDHLIDRTQVLALTASLDRARDYTVQLTSLLTTLTMNFLYTNHFFEVD
ncbi:MAG: putative zinc-binding metallopeptidase [Myxococcaceae bacterium]